jgi:hypothetical protein
MINRYKICLLILLMTVSLAAANSSRNTPDCNVNPHNYEYTMTIIAEVVSERYSIEGDTHLLAVFAQDEVGYL